MSTLDENRDSRSSIHERTDSKQFHGCGRNSDSEINHNELISAENVDKYKRNNSNDDNNIDVPKSVDGNAEERKSVNTSEENREAQQQLRSIINHIITFEDENVCQKYIQSACLEDRIVLIVSGRLGQEVVPRIHHLRQLSTIYVYCMNKQRNEKWAKNFTKVKAVTIQLDDLICRIKADQKQRVKVEDSIVINIFTVNENPDQSTTDLDGGFVHSLLLIDVLLRMKTVETDKRELIELCEKEYKGNKTQLAILREFEKDYSSDNALWWYTRESFLYRMLNKALRVQNIDVLFLFRFFIRDIHRQLERNQCQTPTRTYRGQVLSNDELDNLRKSIGKFISINSFFSTTTVRYRALEFLNSSDVFDNLHRILFEIDANPDVVRKKPFADISSFSEFIDEAEILFMSGSIFRLDNIHRNSNQIWIIRLTLCGDDEYELRTLFEHLKKTYGGDRTASHLNFGQLLRRMGKFDLAEKFYRRLLDELPSNDPSLSILYYSLGLALKDKGDLDQSLKYLHKSLEITLKTSPDDYDKISNRYNVIGNIHRLKGDYDRAISWYNEGINFLKQKETLNQLVMAHFYNNIAIVYQQQEKYIEALDFNKKALVIRQEYLPPNHSDIGLSHNNIGSSYRLLREHDLALQHYEQALNIRLKSLPSNHPHVANSYRNLGLIYENKGELKQALTYFQKAGNICQQSLPAHHSDVIRIKKHIERVSSKLT